MTIARYEPWTLVNRLSRDLDRLFSQSAYNGDESRSAVVDWAPPVDIREEDKQFVLQADLPGVDPKDIEITMEKGLLTLRGRRQIEARDEKSGYRHVERIAGEFYRRFTLPDTADAQAIKARHSNGVLEVVIPKQATVMPRRIDIETH